MHVVDDGTGHRVVLVRDRGHLLPSDRALLLAAQAVANRHVLTGLVHAAKGPLNNFNLTLALLAAGVARGDADNARPGAAAKRARYVEVLQNEAARLAACVDEIHMLTLVPDDARETIDLAALAQDCARVLRHGATMREVVLELDLPARTVNAVGDPALVRLALLSFAISLIELTARGGRVGWQLTQERRGAPPKVAMTTSEASLPRAFASGLFRLACTAESPFAAAIAARLVVEAQGGDVVVHDGSDTTAGILLALPAVN
jgi:signal transduction histidine kinase